MSGDSKEELKKSQKTYAVIGGTLLFLTVVTVAVAKVSLPVAGAIAVAMLVASLKGGLVASIFMHLNHEKRIIYEILAVTAVGFVFVITIPFLANSNQAGENIAPAPTDIHAEVQGEDHGEAAADEHGEEASTEHAEEAPAH